MEIKVTFDEETLSTLHKLADSITRFTEARPSEILPLDGDVDIVEEPKVEEPKVEEPKVEEPKVEEPKVSPTVTIKDIQRLGASIIQADPHKREDVVAVLTTVGQSKKVSDIDPSLFDTVHQALKDIE